MGLPASRLTLAPSDVLFRRVGDGESGSREDLSSNALGGGVLRRRTVRKFNSGCGGRVGDGVGRCSGSLAGDVIRLFLDG
jgi:hypothetical protein